MDRARVADERVVEEQPHQRATEAAAAPVGSDGDVVELGEFSGVAERTRRGDQAPALVVRADPRARMQQRAGDRGARDGDVPVLVDQQRERPVEVVGGERAAQPGARRRAQERGRRRRRVGATQRLDRRGVARQAAAPQLLEDPRELLGPAILAELALAVEPLEGDAHDQDPLDLLAVARVVGGDRHVAALGLVLVHQRREHPGLGVAILDDLERPVDLDAAIVGGRGAGELGVEEVAGDDRDGLLGGDDDRAAHRLHLLAGRRAVERERPVDDDRVDGAQHRDSGRVGGREVDDRAASEQGHGLVANHSKDLLAHARELDGSLVHTRVPE